VFSRALISKINQTFRDVDVARSRAAERHASCTMLAGLPPRGAQEPATVPPAVTRRTRQETTA
jgi:hypothetical protein